jgi:hypothetical protein
MRGLFIALLSIAAGGVSLSQTLPPATVATTILGAGRAGAWDTKIVITNVDSQPLPIVITTQPYATSACASPPCNILAATTIPPLGMFILPSIPEATDPAFTTTPQAVYVLSPAHLRPIPFLKRPAVTALAADSGVACNRSVALPVIADQLISTNGVVLPIDRSTDSYVNLILMQRLSPDPAQFLVEVFDESGSEIGRTSYSMSAGQPNLIIVDLFRQLGLGELEHASIHVFAEPQVVATTFTAIATMVSHDGVQLVPSTQIVDFIPPF